MSKLAKMPQAPVEQRPQFPELYTDADLTSAGEVVSTTAKGQIFVKVDDRVYLFQPVARIHGKEDEYYYNRVEFE
jgi:hypothetical protein